MLFGLLSMATPTRVRARCGVVVSSGHRDRPAHLRGASPAAFADAPGFVVDGRALGVTLGLVVSSSVVIVVSLAFLKRRRWERAARAAITALGILVSVTALVFPNTAIEPPPPDAPAEYVSCCGSFPSRPSW